MFTGSPDVVDYGDRIIYDRISYQLINNLIVYFERHGRQLTDICASNDNLRELEKAFIGHYGSQAEGTFQWDKDGRLINQGKCWGLNFHETDAQPKGYEVDVDFPLPVEDNDLYAFAWNDAGEPWVVKVKLEVEE